MSDYDPARARALLDLYGLRRPRRRRLARAARRLAADARDGHRARADLPRTTTSCGRRCLKAVGLRIALQHRAVAGEPEGRRCRQADDLAARRRRPPAPTGRTRWRRLYGPQAGSQNLARFQLDEFDRIYERTQMLPDGPEREALFLEAKQHRGGLHAVQVHRAPHPHRPAAPVGVRLPAAAVLAGSGGTWSTSTWRCAPRLST